MINSYIDGEKIVFAIPQPLYPRPRINDVTKFIESQTGISSFSRHGVRVEAELYREPLPTGAGSDFFHIRPDDSNWGEYLKEPANMTFLMRNLFCLTLWLHSNLLIRKMMSGQDGQAKSVIIEDTRINSMDAIDMFVYLETAHDITLQLSDVTNNSKRTFNVIVPAVTTAKRMTDQKFMQDNLQSYRNSLTRWANKRVTNLTAQLETAKATYMEEGFQAALKLSAGGWRVIKKSGRDYYNHPGRIYVESVQHDGNMYRLPNELRQEFWLEDLLVPVDKTIASIRAKGFNPHRMNSDSEGGCNSHQDCCMGDLGGKSIKEIDKVTEMYKTINKNSCFGTLATDCIEVMFGRRVFDRSDIDDSWEGAKMKKFMQYHGLFRNSNEKAHVWGEH